MDLLRPAPENQASTLLLIKLAEENYVLKQALDDLTVSVIAAVFLADNGGSVKSILEQALLDLKMRVN